MDINMAYKMIVGEKVFPTMEHAKYAARQMKLDSDYADCEGQLRKRDDGTVVLTLVRTMKRDKNEKV